MKKTAMLPLLAGLMFGSYSPVFGMHGGDFIQLYKDRKIMPPIQISKLKKELLKLPSVETAEEFSRLHDKFKSLPEELERLRSATGAAYINSCDMGPSVDLFKYFEEFKDSFILFRAKSGCSNLHEFVNIAVSHYRMFPHTEDCSEIKDQAYIDELTKMLREDRDSKNNTHKIAELETDSHNTNKEVIYYGREKLLNKQSDLKNVYQYFLYLSKDPFKEDLLSRKIHDPWIQSALDIATKGEKKAKCEEPKYKSISFVIFDVLKGLESAENATDPKHEKRHSAGLSYVKAVLTKKDKEDMSGFLKNLEQNFYPPKESSDYSNSDDD